jgi:hypothetical protein
LNCGGKPPPENDDATFEFKNKGNIKDQTVDQLEKMFAEYVDSRLGIHMREDEIRIGRVIDDVSDGLTRELFLENIRFSDRNDTFLVEANTFIDYKYMVTRS